MTKPTIDRFSLCENFAIFRLVGAGIAGIHSHYLVACDLPKTFRFRNILQREIVQNLSRYMYRYVYTLGIYLYYLTRLTERSNSVNQNNN